ncbi:MAG: hypothetical protein QOJ99_2413 [Bryobacterales bacterium]|jgi:uncharacterized protein (TIGR02271 family)|nr:hypothetical protein [Bryobacterales bacterium]
MDTRTLVATFNDYSTARQAARELEDNGVPPDAVHIDSNQKTAGAGSTGYSNEEHHKSGFSSWWNSLFGSDDDTERTGYESAIAGGGTILRATVPAGMVDSAVTILNRYGAVDIDRRSGTVDQRTASAGTGTALSGAVNEAIEVVEEELQVGKRAIRRGGVRVYSHVVSQPVQEQVRLREERVNVERRPVDREISPEEVSALRDQTVEVTEMAEEPVVAKRARVREEVVVGKEATERTETIRDNVRHTEVEVEPLGQETTGAASSQTGTESGRNPVRATGLSPSAPSPGVMSGFGSTAGSGTLAGDATAGSGARDLTPDFNTHFEQTYGTGSNFESMRPAYEYGYTSAGDPRYKGKSWDQVENQLRSDYQTRNPESTWERVKDAVRHGWEKVTGQR